MKKSTRALLLSLLILPGIGHFVLKRPARGGVLVALALLAVAVIVRETTTQAFIIVDRIERGEMALDPVAIERAVGQVDTISITFALYGLIALWVLAAIDVYRIGRQHDASDRPSNPVAE